MTAVGPELERQRDQVGCDSGCWRRFSGQLNGVRQHWNESGPVTVQPLVSNAPCTVLPLAAVLTMDVFLVLQPIVVPAGMPEGSARGVHSEGGAEGHERHLA